MASTSDPFILIIALVVLALVPFIGVMVTSFIKLAVVLSLVRNALGVQQIPPNMALNGLAIVLSLYIMAPVGYAVMDALEGEELSLNNPELLTTAYQAGIEPLRQFLIENANSRERAFFLRTTRTLWPPEMAERVTENDLLILVPAFTVSEITAAFEIGFLIYLPFVAIDLIVSNILLAMGMMMVSPMTISLPFKLLLFVLLDGWTRLIHGLVLSYA